MLSCCRWMQHSGCYWKSCLQSLCCISSGSHTTRTVAYRSVSSRLTLTSTSKSAKARIALLLPVLVVNEPRVGPGQSPSPYSFTSAPSTPAFSIFYYSISPFLSIYFLAFPSLPILPEWSHSVSMLDVVGGD